PELRIAWPDQDVVEVERFGRDPIRRKSAEREVDRSAGSRSETELDPRHAEVAGQIDVAAQDVIEVVVRWSDVDLGTGYVGLSLALLQSQIVVDGGVGIAVEIDDIGPALAEIARHGRSRRLGAGPVDQRPLRIAGGFN